MAAKPAFFLLLFLFNHHHSYSSTPNPSPIKTIIILVMENRSFDHMLGWMKKLNPKINGADATNSNTLNLTDPFATQIPFTDGAQYVDPDPGHSFQAIRRQIFGSDNSSSDVFMNGFADQACSMNCENMPRAVMSGFDPSQVPIYKALVSEFAVFDRWFASVPASTQPNRLFIHSATSGGATSNIPKLLIRGYPQRTIFDSLDEDNIPFGIYYQNIPATLFYKNLRKIKHLLKFHPYELFFKRHAKEGKLPGYVVVEQRYMDSKLIPANDDHPSHDVYEGQRFVKEVYETLRASPQWNQSLLLITYDEHGGFYDHVPTPVHGVPNPDGIIGQEPFYFGFDRLGVRVPTIVVSPWINKGTVVHGPEGKPFPESEFEHSSISATVKKIFNLSSPFLTKRDEWAGSFEGVVQTMSEPRSDCPVTLPDAVRIRQREADENAKLSEFQEEMLQLAAVLKGDHILTSYPHKIGKQMNVREAKVYMEDAVKRFMETGRLANKMGVDTESIVKMKPSLTTQQPSHINP